MRYIRLWTDERGDSRHQEQNISWHEVMDYAQGLPPVELSQMVAVGTAYFARVLVAHHGGEKAPSHQAPRRQLEIILQGVLELTTGTGEIRAEPGDVILLEDTSGKGHQSRVLGDTDVVVMMVTLSEEMSDAS